MRLSGFGYLVKQGTKNVWINRLMSVACIGVMMACLLIIGIAVLLTRNVASFIEFVEDQNEVIAFCLEGLTEEQYEQLGQQIMQTDNVASYTFISKEEALAAERESFGEYSELLEGLDEVNPLPASYRIVLKDLDKIEETVERIKQLGSFEQVNAPIELSQTISTLQRILFYGGGAIVVVLLVVSLIIIANTVKLAIFSHRREINIMKYCGATDTYIRLPFLIEGTLVGLLASLLSYGLIYILYERAVVWLTSNQDAATGFLASMVDRVVPFSSVAIELLLIFLAFGVAVGLIGSTIFCRKYLKV